jgi:hypothetical protein
MVPLLGRKVTYRIIMAQLFSSKTILSLGLPGVLLLSLTPVAFGQSGGRFEDAKRIAQQYLDSNQFDKAAAKLEEVWEQDKTDPTVAEGLGIAYLNGDDRRYNPGVADKASKIMEESLKLGGKATFLVQHTHEGKVVKLVTGGDSLKYCDGKLSVSHGKLTFVMKQLKGVEDHSFEATADQVKVSGPNGSGGFKISRRVDTKSKDYSMAPRNGNKADTSLILSLIHEQLGAN